MDFSKLAKSLNPYTIKKGFAYLKQYGFKEFKVRLSERFEKEEVDYGQWCAQHALTEDEKKAQRETKWENPVKISVVVPIYKTPEVFLRQMIESVTANTYLTIGSNTAFSKKTWGSQTILMQRSPWQTAIISHCLITMTC